MHPHWHLPQGALPPLFIPLSSFYTPPPFPSGNALGMVGVSTGVGAALASLHVPLPVYAQV